MCCSRCGKKQVDGARSCYACGAEIFLPAVGTKSNGGNAGMTNHPKNKAVKGSADIQKAFSKPPKPCFAWGHFTVYSIIGLYGAAFNVGCAMTAASDRYSYPSTVKFFYAAAFLFLAGWLWVVKQMMAGHRGRMDRYNLACNNPDQYEKLAEARMKEYVRRPNCGCYSGEEITITAKKLSFFSYGSRWKYSFQCDDCGHLW